MFHEMCYNTRSFFTTNDIENFKIFLSEIHNRNGERMYNKSSNEVITLHLIYILPLVDAYEPRE